MIDSGKTKKELILGVSAILIISFSILFGTIIFSLTGKLAYGWIAGLSIALVSTIALLSGDYLEN